MTKRVAGRTWVGAGLLALVAAARLTRFSGAGKGRDTLRGLILGLSVVAVLVAIWAVAAARRRTR